jgi:hypothetical protein
MRAINVHSKLEMDLEGSRRDDSTLSVRRAQPYTTAIASASFDSDERCVVGDSPCSSRHPLPVEPLVQLFVLDTCYVPRTAQRLLDPSELPPALERVAMQAQRCLQMWFAWTDGPRTWFVVTEMATVTSRHHKEKALRLFFFDEDGRFVSWGTWVLHFGGDWILCER